MMPSRPQPPQLDLSGPPMRLHLVGVGGAGMNAMATLLVAMGHQVSGSDARASAVLGRLEGLGVRTYVGHDAAHVGQVDALAFSTAIKPGNPEVDEALRRGIPIYTRPELTRAICQARRVLTVSGTHGKTTTTAMLAAVLTEAGMSPGYIVGGELPGGRGGAEWGRGEWLVVEGDESDGSFLQTSAYGVVVTNIEADHLDFYGDMAALCSAFERFVTEAPGPKVLCADDPLTLQLADRLAAGGAGPGGLVTYGTAPGSTYRISAVRLARQAAGFDISARGQPLARFELPVPGLHNVRNATAALAMALEVGVAPERARAALARFAGVGRRFELKGAAGGVTFVDDYAHNPGKVKAVLAAARQGGWGRVVAVFQPHRYSRTVSLWQEFADAFADADVVVITGIYAAGEQPLPGVDGRLIFDAVHRAHPGLPLHYVEDRAELARAVGALLEPGDLCLTMGAGDLNTLADEVLAALPAPSSPDPAPSSPDPAPFSSDPAEVHP